MYINEFQYEKRLAPNSSSNLPLQLNTESLPFDFCVWGETDQIPITVAPTVLRGFLYQKATTVIIKREDGVTISNRPQLDIPYLVLDDKVVVKIKYMPFNEKVFLDGLDKLIREPYGCFEQTSSTTFPMVMLLQYLNYLDQQTDKITKMKLDIEKKLRKGLKRLLSFETPTGGFEWFGKSPGHATLTAYGIWQFVEMNKLGDYVGKDVLDRSLNWLRGQFDKEKQQFRFGRGLDSFARPPQMISDVYILFVMTLLDNYAVDFSKLLDPVLEKYRKDVFKKNDSYLLAFVGLAFFNQGKTKEARNVVVKLLRNQTESGEFSSVETSITRSRGKGLKIETTAIALILIQSVDFIGYSAQISKSIEFLQKNMQGGYFGSTQSTVLALKALAENSRNINASKRDRALFEASVGNLTKAIVVDSVSKEPVTEFEVMTGEPVEV